VLQYDITIERKTLYTLLAECYELVTNGLKLLGKIKERYNERYQKFLECLKESLKIKFPSCSAYVDGHCDMKGTSDKKMKQADSDLEAERKQELTCDDCGDNYDTL
jgi:hypothetical protein